MANQVFLFRSSAQLAWVGYFLLPPFGRLRIRMSLVEEEAPDDANKREASGDPSNKDAATTERLICPFPLSLAPGLNLLPLSLSPL